MTTDRKKLQKKKAREKQVQDKLRAKREATRGVAREEREELRAQRKFRKEQRQLEALEERMGEFYDKLPPETRAQLERNIEILKALEEEYDAEMAKKQQLNEELEAAGCVTPEEKMKFLHEKAVAQQKDTAIVEVIKAPGTEQIETFSDLCDRVQEQVAEKVAEGLPDKIVLSEELPLTLDGPRVPPKKKAKVGGSADCSFSVNLPVSEDETIMLDNPAADRPVQYLKDGESIFEKGRAGFAPTKQVQAPKQRMHRPGNR